MTAKPDSSPASDLCAFHVVIGVCGGIASYKVCDVVSALAQRGATVTVAMTKSARKFVGEVTFQALSGRPVLTSLWHSDTAEAMRHISLTGEADLLLIAPTTANMLAKMAAGIADDVVSTLLVSATLPVMVAPSMNNRMWDNPVVQRNVKTVRELGHHIIGPCEGWLACRSVGMGRMTPPDELINAVVERLRSITPRS